MILGSHHWLFTEDAILHLLPCELWVHVFTLIHDARIKDLSSKFTRGYHCPEESVLLGNSDEDGYPYLQSYFSSGYLVQTHFHRIITDALRPDLDMRRLGYTLGKMHDIQTKLYENRDDPMSVRWLTARLELFKKDIFKTNIISHCFTYDLAGGGLELIRINYHFVWGDERSNKGSIFFYFLYLLMGCVFCERLQRANATYTSPYTAWVIASAKYRRNPWRSCRNNKIRYDDLQ